MPYAINIRSDYRSARSLELLWERCGQLEAVPSMRTTGYAPHITLAIYDEISLERLFSGAEAAWVHLKRVCIKFTALNYFETPHALILWAVPCLPRSISEAHVTIHNSIDPDLCRLNYRPGVWVPHSTVATSVPLEKKNEVIDLLTQPFEEIEVEFDVLDCAAFSPVRVLKEFALGE